MGVVFAAGHAVIERRSRSRSSSARSRDERDVKRFVQEAKAASRIGHPNIVDVTDFGATPDGMTYLVMEYLDGETLSAALKAEPRRSPARALDPHRGPDRARAPGAPTTRASSTATSSPRTSS